MTEPRESSESPTWEAEYNLESAAKCPGCHAEIAAVQVVRLLRGRVNFTSTLPRRGQVVVCPSCRSILSASLSSL